VLAYTVRTARTNVISALTRSLNASSDVSYKTVLSGIRVCNENSWHEEITSLSSGEHASCGENVDDRLPSWL